MLLICFISCTVGFIPGDFYSVLYVTDIIPRSLKKYYVPSDKSWPDQLFSPTRCGNTNYLLWSWREIGSHAAIDVGEKSGLRQISYRAARDFFPDGMMSPTRHF